jgi:hypothetical protein
MVIDLKWWVFTVPLNYYNTHREKFQKKNIIEKYLGKYCKIITKETSEGKTHAISGIIVNIDQDEDEIVVETFRGVFYLKIETILKIKPRRRLKRYN